MKTVKSLMILAAVLAGAMISTSPGPIPSTPRQILGHPHWAGRTASPAGIHQLRGVQKPERGDGCPARPQGGHEAAGLADPGSAVLV